MCDDTGLLSAVRGFSTSKRRAFLSSNLLLLTTLVFVFQTGLFCIAGEERDREYLSANTAVGRVLDSTGSPYSEAEVVIYLAEARSFPLGKAKTDDEGKFSVKISREKYEKLARWCIKKNEFFGSRKGYPEELLILVRDLKFKRPPRWVRTLKGRYQKLPAEPVFFEFGRTWRLPKIAGRGPLKIGDIQVKVKPILIKGKLTDWNGKPLAKARIRWVLSVDDFLSRGGPCWFTDENGNYLVDAAIFRSRLWSNRIYLEVVPANYPDYRYPLCIQIPENKLKQHHLVIEKDMKIPEPVQVEVEVVSIEEGGPLPAVVVFRGPPREWKGFYLKYVLEDGRRTVLLPKTDIGVSAFPLAGSYYYQWFVEDMSQKLQPPTAKGLPRRKLEIPMALSPYRFTSRLTVIIEGTPVGPDDVPWFLGRILVPEVNRYVRGTGFREFLSPLTFYADYSRTKGAWWYTPAVHAFSRDGYGYKLTGAFCEGWEYMRNLSVGTEQLMLGRALDGKGRIVSKVKISPECQRTIIRDILKHYPETNRQHLEATLQEGIYLPFSGGFLRYHWMKWFPAQRFVDLKVCKEGLVHSVETRMEYVILLESLTPLFTDVHMDSLVSIQKCAFYRAHWDIGWGFSRYFRQNYFEWLFPLWEKGVKVALKKYTKDEFIKRLRKLKDLIDRQEELQEEILSLTGG